MFSHVEIWDVDHYVLAVDQHDFARWTAQGYTVMPAAEVLFAIDAALARAEPEQLRALWTALFGPGSPGDGAPHAMRDELRGAALRPAPRLQVLSRELKRGFVGEPFRLKEPNAPPRLDTEHYIVVQAVDPQQKPVAGVQLELLIAGGEVRGAITDSEGIARVERIRAGSVVVRVLSVDGAMWRPLDGAASQPSSTEDRVRWHTVAQGECLSTIAHRYNLEGWQKLWDHPKNEPLRKKRTSPHVLHPGDQVALPGVAVHEIVRPTDAAHRIEVRTSAATSKVIVVFRNDEGEALASEQYELRFEAEGVSQHKSGQLDGAGELCEELPLTVQHIEVLLPARGQRYRLVPGYLNPTEHEQDAFAASGVEARLTALGYLHRGAGDSHVTDATRAVRAFQERVMGRKDATGELDAATCRKLEEMYGV